MAAGPVLRLGAPVGIASRGVSVRQTKVLMSGDEVHDHLAVDAPRRRAGAVAHQADWLLLVPADRPGRRGGADDGELRVARLPLQRVLAAVEEFGPVIRRVRDHLRTRGAVLLVPLLEQMPRFPHAGPRHGAPARPAVGEVAKTQAGMQFVSNGVHDCAEHGQDLPLGGNPLYTLGRARVRRLFVETTPTMPDGLCSPPAITMRAHHLLSTVCILGGADCPLLDGENAARILETVKANPTATVRLVSPAEEVPHFTRLPRAGCACTDSQEVLNRKRDLDVLQRLGLLPGDVRRARYLYTLLFDRIETPLGICAYDTPGWEGCPLASSGAYERVRAKGWTAVVYCRSPEEMAEYRRRNAECLATGDRLYLRPHHLMCLACWYGGTGGESPRPNDTLYEVHQRIRRQPDVPIVLVEGCCQACDCCDGFHPETGRCVHAGGLIRDYKKDLDVFQKLGLMPGATLPARELIDLLFGRIPSTRDICGYGDGIVRSEEWAICSDPEGNPGYARARQAGLLQPSSG